MKSWHWRVAGGCSVVPGSSTYETVQNTSRPDERVPPRPPGRMRLEASRGSAQIRPRQQRVRIPSRLAATGRSVTRRLVHQSFADRPGRIDPCVVEYAYVIADENGDDQIIASGETEEGTETPDVGTTVTLTGPDGVGRPWNIVRKIPVAYAGETIYVEPAEVA
jgi:hypothetical protein